MNINVLTNFYGGLYSSVKMDKKGLLAYHNQYSLLSIDTDSLRTYGAEEGLSFTFMTYQKADAKKDYDGQLFIYTSSEDPGLMQKGYMEDVLYGLKLKGAVLIPEWRYMRAHHNKVMMEKIRDIELSSINTGIYSRYYGCNEDFMNEINEIVFPCVYKSAEGTGSRGVALLKDKNSAIKFLKKENLNERYSLKQTVNRLLGRSKPPYYSRYRNKFVIQNFVQGLSGDFKVLVFGEKYYALSRTNRDNDFRASGSGRLNYEPTLPKGIFDFAKSIYEALNVPVVSLDVAYDGNRFYLIEFQCLNFGTATLENSTHYYALDDGNWRRYDATSVLEKEIAVSLKRYLTKNALYNE